MYRDLGLGGMGGNFPVCTGTVSSVGRGHRVRFSIFGVMSGEGGGLPFNRSNLRFALFPSIHFVH